MASKWRKYDSIIKKILLENPNKEWTFYAKKIIGCREGSHLNPDVGELARYISRNNKAILDTNEGMYSALDELDVNNSSVKHLWIKNKNTSAFVKNPNYLEPDELDTDELHNKLIETFKEYAPKYNTYKRSIKKEPHLLIIDPADIHIGKLCSAFEVGEDYNSQIAVKRVLTGVDGILDKSSSLSIDKILFIIGNDILHIDNPKRTTTSGTPQDTDGMWFDNFLIAKQLYVDIIEKLICVADVEVIFNPSNHDYTNGFFLAQLIETHFRNCENVKFDCSISHRKYFVYGENLIGTSHGDGAKQQDLPLLMAHESKEWVNCKYKYFYIHHFHHKISKDYMSVCVEALRTSSGTDSWHHRNGFEHAPKAVEGFVHHPKYGQIMRITHLF